MQNNPVIYNMRYVVFISFIAALGGILFGYDTAVIAGTTSFIKPYFLLDEYSLGWAVSCILVGCAAGAIIAGYLCDKLGRKKVLLLCAVLFAATGIITALSTTLTVFVTFRIIGGLAVGVAAMASPMYIAETVPAKWRGRLVSLYQLAIVSGILFAYTVNYFLADTGENNWRWMFAIQAVPSLLFFLFLFMVPESPRWLIKNNETAKAATILTKIGGIAYCEEEKKSIGNSFSNKSNASIGELFKPTFSKVIWLGIFIAIFQQVTGINAILYYVPEIFKNTGVSTENALLQSIGIGLVNLLFTVVAMWLVDKTGRRILLLSGCLIMCISLVVVALCFLYQYFDNYLVLIFLMLYIAGFSASLGAVTWVILSEIFPNRIRSLALSLCTLILWIADFVASFLFQVLNKKLGVPATLLIFASLCITYFFYIKFKVPETKGKTLEELEQQFTL